MNVASQCTSLIEHEMKINGKKFRLQSKLVNKKNKSSPWWLFLCFKCETRESLLTEFLAIDDRSCTIKKRFPIFFITKYVFLMKWWTHVSHMMWHFWICTFYVSLSFSVRNGILISKETVETSMSDEELKAFRDEWEKNWRPGFQVEVVSRSLDMIIPKFI